MFIVQRLELRRGKLVGSDIQATGVEKASGNAALVDIALDHCSDVVKIGRGIKMKDEAQAQATDSEIIICHSDTPKLRHYIKWLNASTHGSVMLELRSSTISVGAPSVALTYNLRNIEETNSTFVSLRRVRDSISREGAPTTRNRWHLSCTH